MILFTIDYMHCLRRFERDVGGYFRVVWDRRLTFGPGLEYGMAISLIIVCV